MKKSNNSEIDSTLIITLLKVLTFKITVLVGYASKKLIRLILPFPKLIPWITLALKAKVPVKSSFAFGVWIIDASLVRNTFQISEYINLFAIVIGITNS